MKKVFFCRNTNASWAIRDRDILAENNDVYDFFIDSPFKYLRPTWALNLLKSDLIFCWFASFSFIPCISLAKLSGKKIILVSGGFDAAAAHSINYGAFTRGVVSQFLRRKLFAMADKVLCVSKANMLETLINAKVEGEKCELVYHGFRPLDEKALLIPWEERNNQVLMISQCDRSTFYRKGIDQFLKLATLSPKFEFILMGEVNEDFQKLFDQTAPNNFRYTGFVPFKSKAFSSLLNQSKFILQLSIYESFGCSVIDGSVMGCFPITTNQYSLFEVVEGLGSSFPHGDINSIAEEIKKLSSMELDVQRISEASTAKFPLELRKEKLLNSMNFS